jgi:hypothetical protein
MGQDTNYLDIKNFHDWGEVFYNILIVFDMPVKLVRPSITCWNDTYSKLCKGEYLSDTFSLQNDLKQENALSPLFFNLA